MFVVFIRLSLTTLRPWESVDETKCHNLWYSIYLTVKLQQNVAAFRPVSRDDQVIGPPWRRAEMYAGCVAYCPLVSHGEYADGTDNRRTDGRTDGRQTVTLRFPLDAASVIK